MIASRIAGIIAAQNPQGIYVHNRVIEVARGAGFGIWPINTSDTFSHAGSHHLSDEAIIERIRTGFSNHFQLSALVNALCAELETLIAKFGYQGKRGLENDHQQEEYAKFNECINRFIPIEMENVLEIDPSGKVIKINWQNVKGPWLKKLRDEGYVSLSQEEAALLYGLLHEAMSLDATTLTMLIPHGYELVQCLEFFSEWSIEQKATIVHTYLNSKSPDEQKEVLAILHNEAPQLTIELKKERRLQAIYVAIAIAEKDVAVVRTYVEQGEDINAALPLLFSQAHFPPVFDSFSGLGYEWEATQAPAAWPGSGAAVSKLMSSKSSSLGRIIQPEVAISRCLAREKILSDQGGCFLPTRTNEFFH